MTTVQVTKHASDGRPPYTYPARLIEAPPGWVAVEARWPMRRVDAGPISFLPGDLLTEFFALDDYFNAFLVHRPDGVFGGWYCNITHPTRYGQDEIHWHDLYLDIIIDVDGQVHLEDEDELEESGLAVSDPDLYQTIIATRDRVLALIERNAYPFSYQE